MIFRVKYLFLFMCLLAFKSAAAHELNFGLFELFEKEQSYFMQIRLDKTNLIEAVGNNADFTPEDWNCSLSQYLDANMNLAFNGTPVQLEFQEFSYLEDVIVFTVKLNLPNQVISTIEINNTVLLDTIENQTNIIKTSFHDRKRSFRLNRERVSTTIKYYQ